MSFDNGLDAHQQAVLDYKYEQLMKEAKKKDPKLHAQMMKEIDLINNKNYSNDEMDNIKKDQLGFKW